MASSSSQPTVQSGLPSLVPHGRFKGKPAMPLGRPVTVIGGRSRSHLHLVSPQVSKSHAMVVNNGSGFYVRDLASRTHVYVNGQQITEAVLKDGDILAVGPFTFRFTDPKKSSSSKPAPDAAPAVLRASDRALPVSLDSRVTIIGRRSNCDVTIDDIEVSTTHAVILEMNGKHYVRDLGSRTGTFVNGTPVHQQALEFGDEVKVAGVTMTYAEAADDLLGEVGSEVPDVTEDLAGTAHLPAEEPLVFNETPAPAAARVAAPVAPEPSAVDEDDLDVPLQPVVSDDGDDESSAPAPIEPIEAVAPLTPAPLDDVNETAAAPEAATESALGIELLPHDHEEEPAPPTATAPPPASVESDFGLDFEEPSAPAATAPPVPSPEDLAGLEAVELTPDVAEMPTAEAAEDALELAPAKLDDVEVVEKTEPTPESALDLDEVLPASAATETEETAKPQAATPAETMTDSVFGREVEAFEGPGLGPIVEPTPTSAAEASSDDDIDALIYDDVTSAPPEAPPSPSADEVVPEAAPTADEPAPTKRRGGRKAAGAKAPRKSSPKRKPPTKVETPEVVESAAPVELPPEPALAGESLAPAPAAETPVELPEPTPEPVADVLEDALVSGPAAEAAAEETPAEPIVPAPLDETPAPLEVPLHEEPLAEPAPLSAEQFEQIESTATAEAAPVDSLVFDESGQTVEPLEPATPAAVDETTSPETAEPGAETGEPAKPADLFFGLERDTASFLGGMPLSLPPLPAPPPEAVIDESTPVEALDDDETDLMPEIGGVGFEDAPPVAPPPSAIEPMGRGGRPAPPPPARSGGRERKRQQQDAAAPRGPVSPFDVNFEDLRTDSIEIPPFAGPGAATRGQVTTAFDGLAMPPVREGDVFSQKTFGAAPAPGEQPTIPPFTGEAGSPTADDGLDDFDDEPLDLSAADDDGDDDSNVIPPSDSEPAAVAREEDEASEVEPAEEAAAAAAATSPDARKQRPAVAPPRRPAPYPTDAPPGRATPKKKRWRIGKWGLFGLFLALVAIDAAVIWFGWPHAFPNLAQVTAAIKFDNLDKLPETDRQQIFRQQHDKLEKPEVRAAAREILAVNHANVPPGFLAETSRDGDVKAAAVEFLKLTDGLKLLEKKPIIQLRYGSREGENDRVRVVALLDALHAENKPLIDRAAELNRSFEAKSNELMLATERLKKDVMPRVESARSAIGDQNAVLDKQAVVEALQRKEKELAGAWNETTKRLRDFTADVKAAESSVPVDANAKTPAAEDPQVAELSKRVEQLTASLAAKRQQRATKTDEARKALATALKEFEDDITQARGSMKPDSELGRYLDKASRMQSQLVALSNELAAQQRSDMERLLLLKRKLAEKNETRIRNAFASDSELQSLQETLALKERQFSAATGSGLRDEARSLEKEVKGLKLEIESRQDLLTTADGIAPDMKDLEAYINETLARMDSDRSRNDRNMAAMLKDLASQAPAAGSLPEEQKAFAEQLEKRQSELNKARERFTAAADAAAAEADEQVKSIESDLATAQAKVDERRKQVAEAARKSLTEEQQRERKADTEVRRRDMERAQKADQAAADAYWANRKALNDASDELEKVKKRSEAFEKQQAEENALHKNITALGVEVDRLHKQIKAGVVPIAPTDDEVVLTPAGPDSRINYISGTVLLLALIFVPLMLMAPAHPRFHDEPEMVDHVNGEDVPFAAPTPRDPDELAVGAASVVEDATARRQSREQDQPEATPVGA